MACREDRNRLEHEQECVDVIDSYFDGRINDPVAHGNASYQTLKVGCLCTYMTSKCVMFVRESSNKNGHRPIYL